MLFATNLALFAQAGAPGNRKLSPDEEAAMAGLAVGYFVCIGVIFIVSLILQIMFLLAMSRALAACSPENRTMEPGSVWLVFIPLAGIVFHIMMLFKVPESIQNEYRSRRLRGDDDFGKNAAIWYLVGAFVCAPVGLVFFFIFWSKISGYTKVLNGSASGERSEDDDDRPRRRRRDDDDRDEPRDERDDDRDDDRGEGEWRRRRRD